MLLQKLKNLFKLESKRVLLLLLLLTGGFLFAVSRAAGSKKTISTYQKELAKLCCNPKYSFSHYDECLSHINHPQTPKCPLPGEGDDDEEERLPEGEGERSAGFDIDPNHEL